MLKTPVATLQEYCQKENRPLPEYTLVDQRSGTHLNSFTIRVVCGEYKVDATGSSKKSAKHDAAAKMIQTLNNHNHKISCDASFLSPKKDDSVDDTSDASNGINYVGQLQELCVKNKLIVPTYAECPATGSSFKCCCALKDIKKFGEGLTKKQAKQKAAEEMVKEMQKFDLQYTGAAMPQVSDNLFSSCILKIDKLNLETNVNIDDSSKKARELFPELKKNHGFLVRDDYCMSNVHLMFKNSIDSTIQAQFQSYYDNLQLETMINDDNSLLVHFKHICQLMNVSFTKSSIKTKCRDQCAIGYALNTKPVYLEIGFGDSEQTANFDAIKRMIDTIYTLLL